MGPIEPTTPWADSYAPVAGVRTLSLGGRSLVYAEDQQQVLELNETADCIWRALARTGTVSAAAQELGALGLSIEQAVQLVRDAALEWTIGGYLAPQALGAGLDSGCSTHRTLVLDELVVEFHLRGVDGQDLDPVFGHLYATRQGPRRRITVIAQAGRLLFYVERRLVLVGGGDGLVAHVKAILTDLYIDAVETGFLAHGALLLKGERRLLLSGEPGVGKTTLALALVAAGWQYGGDDIVHILPDGAARGVPFAAAVKDGSVSLLSEIWPDLRGLPVSVRSDGQQARYLLPANRAAAPPRPLSVVVMLARRRGAPTEARQVSAFDALSAIVQSAYARRWRMNGDAFCALAESLDQAVCARLEYCDLEPAVQAIESLVHVQAPAA